jgi:hypothetical protein
VSRQAVHRWVGWYRDEGWRDWLIARIGLTGCWCLTAWSTPFPGPSTTPAGRTNRWAWRSRPTGSFPGRADERLSLRLPAAVTPAAPVRHPARPSSAPVEPQRVQRRVSCRGALVVAGQRIHVGIVHAGRTLTVEAADSTWRIYDGDDGLIAEVARTTTNPSPGQDPQP